MSGKKLNKTVAKSKGMIGPSNATLTVNSFFAGIGGFDLGFQRSGIRPIFHCELSDFCLSVLNRHWPNTESAQDILEVDSGGVPEADIWCGGFPCQDVSVARGWLGRDGLKGKNTGLFFPFFELVKQRKPKILILENVTGLLNSQNGRDFAVIIQSLQNLGYGVAWRVLNTRYFGAPQSRPRVYICAWENSAKRALNVLYEQGPTFRPENQRLAFLRETMCKRTGAYVPEVAFCLAATSGRHTGTDWSRSYVSYEKEVRRLTPTECERLQGFPEDWTLPSESFRLSDDRIDTLRYHAIGNAVSVPTVEWIARRIKAVLKRTYEDSNGGLDDWALLMEAQRSVQDFTAASQIEISNIIDREKSPKIKWGTGGIANAGCCLTSSVSSSPRKPFPSFLVDILDQTRPAKSYFLSPNAATGILRRVESQNRKLFAPLDSALRHLSKTEN